MMPHAYRIRNWSEHFETYESGKVKGPLAWVATPTKHDGRGYKRMTRLPNAVPALCAWWSMLQVAAKMPVHGLLADRDGPLDAEDIAEKTNLPAKIYVTAFKAASDDRIGWLETVPWNQNLDFAGNIAALIDSQHLPADALDYQRKAARTSGKQRKADKLASPVDPLPSQDSPAETSAPAGNPAENSGRADPPASVSVQDRTRQDKTEPPAVPQGTASLPNLIRDAIVAKRLICEKILGGRDPGRMWSAPAENNLARKCKDEGGIPLQEIFDIAEWRSIQASDDIPELKFRREPLTETALMEYWGDEWQRASAYLKKYRRNGAGEKKEPDPKLWREFFWWKYGEQCELPDYFAQLDDDQKNEWRREHEEWEQSPAGQTAEALAV